MVKSMMGFGCVMKEFEVFKVIIELKVVNYCYFEFFFWMLK